MIIGVTERGSYKRCRRQWHLSSRNRHNLERLIPHTTSLPLGTVIHASLSRWLLEPTATLSALYHEEAVKFNNEIVQRYREQVGAPISQIELQPLHDDMTMGLMMMENYQEFWKSPLPPAFTLVSPEQQVIVDIPGTEHTEEWVLNHDTGEIELLKYVTDHEYDAAFLDNPISEICRICGRLREHHGVRRHKLQGRLDAIIANSKGSLFVLEHKTYGQNPRRDVLYSNDQFLAYPWMLTQLNMGQVGGVAYDGMWKRAAPPKGKELKDLFTRELISRPPEELEEFELMLAAEANEMASNPPIYINRTWDGSCHWGCGMNELCLAMSRGEDADWVRSQKYALRPENEEKSHEIST